MQINNAFSLLRRRVSIILWVLYFILTFRLLARLPIGIVEELLFIIVLFTIIIISMRHMFKSIIHGKLKILHLIIIPLLIVPFVSAWQALHVFGQPYLYGVAPLRENYLILNSIFVIFVLSNNWISYQKLEKNFITAMYVMLAIMFFFYIFIDPSSFGDSDFVKNAAGKGWIYKFPNGVAAGLLFYCLIKAWIENKTSYYIPLLICLVYFILYGQDRSQIFFLFTTMGLLYTVQLNFKKKFLYGLYSFILIIIGSMLLVFIKPDIFEKYIDLYASAASIFTGEQTADASTNIRFTEGAIGLKGFLAHPWLGNGFLSSQWQNGYLGLYKYFYPADIGFLGNLYVFGIIGTLFFYIVFLAAFKWAYHLRKEKDPFLLTSIYSLIFLFLDMTTAASNIKFIGMPAFFIGVIYYYRFYIFPKSENPERNLTADITN